MYKRLHTFLNNNNITYNLQFRFKQNYFTSHALIDVTENIRKALDDGNIGCGVLLDSQKTFYTVDHQILLATLNHCGICGVSNDWVKSDLSGFDSDLSTINFGFPQRSVLGSLLFQLYIDDLNQARKFCKVHHFAYDTNILSE